MAHPTPRADALRQMREAKFEAEQKRLKQETGKPAETAKPKPEPVAGGEDKPTKPVAEKGAKAIEKPVEKAAPKKAAAKKAKAPAK
jgi:hypothetical protein